MDKKNSTMIIVAVVAIALIVLLFYKYGGNKTPYSYQQPTGTNMPAANVPAAGTSSSSLHRGLTYTQAIDKYPNRIQFNNCHGAVGLSGLGSLSIKKGQLFMLDNHDPKAHTIAFKYQSYRVGANDFAIVSANTLGTYPLTCDGGGSVTLNVG